jgi:site-specific DNA-cytosine methylase
MESGKIKMKVLVGCEMSGRVREAFRKRGHDAWSCDLMDSEISSTYHIIDDVLNHLDEGWDLLIAHPPCRYLAVSGARWFAARRREQMMALDFVNVLMNSPVKKIAIENPVSIISSKIRKPDQIIQPWQFGHGETKATCLWLKNLPKLKSSHVVRGREARIHNMPPSKNRGMERSRTYQGIADAMAIQWGNLKI